MWSTNLKGDDGVCQDCRRLHEQLQVEAEEKFHLKRRITRLQGELKHERHLNRKLRIERQKESQHFRKGRKRGRTFNG